MRRNAGVTVLSFLLSLLLAMAPLVGPAAYADEVGSGVNDPSAQAPTGESNSATAGSDDDTLPNGEEVGGIGTPEDPSAGDSSTPSGSTGDTAGDLEGQLPQEQDGADATDASQEQSDDSSMEAKGEQSQSVDQPSVEAESKKSDAEVEVEEKNAKDKKGLLTTAAENDAQPSVVGRGYAAGKWSAWSTAADQVSIGVAGNRLDAFSLKLSGVNGTITYKAHVQGVGWQKSVSDGGVAGLAGRGKRIEAIEVSLSGDVATQCDVWYRVCVEGTWMGWTKNGSAAGTTGKGKRIEQVQVCLTKRDAAAPGSTSNAYVDNGMTVQAHVQKKGWMGAKHGYNVTVGTTGKALRMEALKISRPGLDLTGDIVYRAHVQRMGWMSECKNGAVGGTSGKGYRIEALRVRLTGELGQRFDVYYRVHVSKVGWLSWAMNGQDAGTQGMSMRVESIQIALVEKGQGAPAEANRASYARFMRPPSASFNAHNKSGWTGAVGSGKTVGTTGKSLAINAINASVSSENAGGVISYRAHVGGTGWMDWCSNGIDSGNFSNRVEAVQFRLDGELSKFFDVWYRAHVASAGWLGWAKNGEQAGSTGAGKAMEAFQVRILPKGSAAPGSTANHIVNKSFFSKASSVTQDKDGAYYHNVPWAGQPNSYYCGPTAGYMILKKLGATRSAKGDNLTIGNVAVEMGTNTTGFTSFNNRSFAHGLNQWLGKYIYTTIANPSYSEIRTAVMNSFKNGYPVAVDAHERAGGPHYNGHNDASFSHILVIDGYNPKTDAVYFADPGASVLWGSASSKFWYPSLRTFTEEYLAPYPWRDGIGMMAPR